MICKFSKVTLTALLAMVLHSLDGQLFADEQSASGQRGLTGQQVIRRVAKRVGDYRTLEAKLRVRTNVLGQPLVGSGVYAQAKSTTGLLLRLELAIQAGGQASSVKQICSGTKLWEQWRIGEQERLHHIDLQRVNRELARNGSTPTAGSMSANLARGGLPKVLSQLDSHFDFNQIPIERDEISKEPMWKLTGRWRPDQLGKSHPDAVQDGQVMPDKLPIHLPYEVQVHVGQSDWFPYRITYRRAASESTRLEPMVITEFYEVAIDEDIDGKQFIFHQPSNARIADRTDSFLQSLRATR